MDVKRTVGGWILKMGDKARLARSLAPYVDAGSLVSFAVLLISGILFLKTIST
jgi:hypothetical protein